MRSSEQRLGLVRNFWMLSFLICGMSAFILGLAKSNLAVVPAGLAGIFLLVYVLNLASGDEDAQ